LLLSDMQMIDFKMTKGVLSATDQVQLTGE
jgi:hypothetical protein